MRRFPGIRTKQNRPISRKINLNLAEKTGLMRFSSPEQVMMHFCLSYEAFSRNADKINRLVSRKIDVKLPWEFGYDALF